LFWNAMIFDWWRDDRLLVFGFPMHKRDATRRERIPASIAEQLAFDPDTDDAVARLRLRDDGFISILPATPDMVHYRQIRFYPNPAEVGVLAPWNLIGLAAPDLAISLGLPDHKHAPQSPRRHCTAEQIREATRVLYDELADDPPSIARAEVLIRHRLPGAVRTRIRPVLDEPEFRNLRRRPGEKRRT
jgi:hypothetical protein